MQKVEIDLYEKYKNRQDRQPLLEPDQFYMCLRILMSCDAAHDFTTPRATDVAADAFFEKRKDLEKLRSEARENFKRYISELLANDIIREKSYSSSLEYVIKQIKEASVKVGTDTADMTDEEILMYFFSSDTKAKATIGIILHILGIHRASASDYYYKTQRFSCDEGYNILGLLQAIHQFDGKKSGPVNIRIDQSSDKTNLIPVYGSMIDSALRRREGCKGIIEFKCIYDLATMFDASNDDSLQIGMKSLDLVKEDLNDITFDIKCDTHGVFNGKLYLENDVVKLRILKYFNRVTDIIRDSNKKGSAGFANNSVAGITNEILNNLKTATPETVTAINGIINTNLIACKTAGDFLQIMRFLEGDQKNGEKMYLSFDIASAEIASIFHRNVFLENTYGSKGKTAGYTEGLTIFLSDLQRIERDSTRSVMDFLMAGARSVAQLVSPEAAPQLPSLYRVLSSARESRGIAKGSRSGRSRPSRSPPRTRFGKKTNKISSMSNEELKTKLKSVGILVTKLNSKRKRLPLTRKEMEKKANLFKNLQIQAKKKGIKLMYKSKRRGYVYKSYTRLINELERIKTKKAGRVSKFG